MNHKDLTGEELHVPFIYGPDSLKKQAPKVGEWYFAIDTNNLYSCAEEGVWTTKGLVVDASLSATNKVVNGSFEMHTLGNTSVPDGFTLEGTPTLATDTGDIGYGFISQKITSSDGLEGIKIVLTGLKASTTYSVSWRTKVSSGKTSRVTTSGAYIDLSAVDSVSTTFETKFGSFTTTATGDNVTLFLLAVGAGDVVWFDGLSVIEGSIPFAFSPKPAEDGIVIDHATASTIVGWTSFTEKVILCKRIGTGCLINFSIAGVSNDTSATFTIPYTTKAVVGIGNCSILAQDNSGTKQIGWASINENSNVVNCYPTPALGDWKNLNNKSVKGQLFVEIA